MTTSKIKEFTQEEKQYIATELRKKLGPEFLSQRAGPGGSRLTYIEGRTAINIANDIFGFDGWSSELRTITIDYIEESAEARVNVGVSVIVRVTLKDGTFHEDIGYGQVENGRGKAASLEKAKKEATTDALKRALRMFGNALGNCVYDKSYISQIKNVKAPNIPFDVKNLYRDHSSEQTEKQRAHPPPANLNEQAKPVASSSKSDELKLSQVPPIQPEIKPLRFRSIQKGKADRRKRSSVSTSKDLPKLSVPASESTPDTPDVDSNNTDSLEEGFTQYGDDAIFQQLIENEDFDKADSQIFYDDPSLHFSWADSETAESKSRKRSTQGAGTSSRSPKRKLNG